MNTMPGAITRAYRPFTMEAAKRIAAVFEISPHSEALFKVVTGATESYEKFLLMPDMSQQKVALEKLSKALGRASTVAIKHQRALEDPLDGSLVRGLGELLTYRGIERLTGPVARPVVRETFTTGDDYEKRSEFDRSATAAGAGPRLLIALLQDMKGHTDQILMRGRQDRGGREPKDLLRTSLIDELARHYSWFFDSPPTSSATGSFTNLCRAILDELGLDQTGLEKAIENEFAREDWSKPGQ